MSPPCDPSPKLAAPYLSPDYFAIAAGGPTVYLHRRASLPLPPRPTSTLVNPSPSESTPSPEGAEPSRKYYDLKPRDYDTVNGPPRLTPTEAAPTGPDPGITPATAGPITVENLRAAAVGSQPLLGANAPLNRPNEVHGLLNLNRQREQQAERDKIIISPKRASRRNRDFWLLVACAFGGCIGFTGLVSGFNPAVMLFGLGAGLFLSLALTWIMWFVMDDY